MTKMNQWRFLWILLFLAFCPVSLQQGNTQEDFKVHEQQAGIVIGAVFGSIIGLAVIVGVIVCICVMAKKKKKQRVREQNQTRVQRREFRQPAGQSGRAEAAAPPPYTLQAPPAYTEAPADPPPFFQGYRNPETLINNYNNRDEMPSVE